MTQEIVRFNKVSKRYSKNLNVLDELSFSVLEGQKCGLIGLNGSGKSTTLNILLKQIESYSGEVLVFNKPIENFSSQDFHLIGYLSDQFPLMKELRVLEYFDYIACIKGRDEAHFNYLLDYFSIHPIKNKTVGHLSKGQKQLLGIIQALMNKPKLVILDEPMVNLDPVYIFRLREYLKELESDRTLLISSHRLNEVENICDRFIFLHNGKDIYPQIDQVQHLKVKFDKKIQDPLSLDFEIKKIEINDQQALLTFDQLSNDEIQKVSREVLACFEGVSFFSWEKSIEDALIEFSQEHQ